VIRIYLSAMISGLLFFFFGITRGVFFRSSVCFVVDSGRRVLEFRNRLLSSLDWIIIEPSFVSPFFPFFSMGQPSPRRTIQKMRWKISEIFFRPPRSSFLVLITPLGAFSIQLSLWILSTRYIRGFLSLPSMLPFVPPLFLLSLWIFASLSPAVRFLRV